MDGIGVYLIKVGIVILAIVLAIYLWINQKTVFNALMVLVIGLSVYTLDVIHQIQSGACVLNTSGTAIKAILILNSCVDSASKPVFAAQVLILGGIIAILFNPLIKSIKHDIEKANKDDGVNE